MLKTTRSEQARHARAQQLQALLELGRGLLDQADQRQQLGRAARPQ
jgi:hypothetical protein